MRFKNALPLLALLGTIHFLHAEPVDLSALKGDWHLRVMDGYDVRKVRAILDFHPDKMRIEGFDACNRISGKLVKIKEDTYKSTLMATRMACRGQSFTFVSKRLHETIAEGFTIKEEKRYGVDGITIKSAKHDLFFKRMGE
jgi:heat shock protein HslJ